MSRSFIPSAYRELMNLRNMKFPLFVTLVDLRNMKLPLFVTRVEYLYGAKIPIF